MCVKREIRFEKEANTNCGIARILGTLLTNSFDMYSATIVWRWFPSIRKKGSIHFSTKSTKHNQLADLEFEHEYKNMSSFQIFLSLKTT